MNHFAASTLGYPGGEQQQLEADIIIIAQRQDHRPSQNQIELMRSKIQNKEGGIMSDLSFTISIQDPEIPGVKDQQILRATNLDISRIQGSLADMI